MSPIVTLRSPLHLFLSNIIHPSRSPDQPRNRASGAPGRPRRPAPGPATTECSARNIIFALVEAPVTLAETRHECQRRGAEPAGRREGCTVTRPVGVPRLVPLV